MLDKKIVEIKFSDIENLVINKIPESSILDYKSEMIKNEKLAKLMISFANGSGGIIVIGVSELKINGKNTGQPDKILGIDRGQYKIKIADIASSYSQPKIHPEINDEIAIPNDPTKVIVVIRIKESLKPIMFYSANHSWSNKWFIRINDQIVTADNSLVEKLFNKEHYKNKKKIKLLFDNIKRWLDEIRIDQTELKQNSNEVDFLFVMKKSWDHPASDDARLNEFQKEFQNLLKLFKDDLKYFGGFIEPEPSFYLGRYKFFSKRIRCPSYLNLDKTNVISTLLNDLKDFCKTHFLIDIDDATN